MIACPQCGQESPQGSLHCVHCGTRVGEEPGPAKTQFGMPALRPLGAGTAEPRKPGSLLAGLPALRNQTSSPLVSGEFSLKGPEGVDGTAKTLIGIPLFEGLRKAEASLPPPDPEAPTLGMPGVTDAQLAAAEEPAATVAMQGLTDEQVAALTDEGAATVAMQGLTDAQVAAAEEPVATVAMQGLTDEALAAATPAAEGTPLVKPVTPVRPVRKDDPAHHPQRPAGKEATSARKAGQPKGGAAKWIVVLVVLAAAGATAWYFLR